MKPILKLKRNHLKIKKEWFKKLVRARNSRLIVAEVDGQLAGYAILQVKKTAPVFAVEEYGYFGDIYVKPMFRGKGVSTALFQAGRRWFREKGLKWIAIDVHWGNTRAREIYQHWGFFPRNLEMWRKV